MGLLIGLGPSKAPGKKSKKTVPGAGKIEAPAMMIVLPSKGLLMPDGPRKKPSKKKALMEL